MVPDTKLRLSAVLKALDDVIAPAIGEESGFAREQLELIKKSIGIVIEQIPYEYGFLIRDALDTLELVKNICLKYRENQNVTALLQDSAARVEALLPGRVPDRITLEESLGELKRDLEQAVNTLAADPKEASHGEIARIVIAYTERRTIFERTWVRGTGFDPDPDSLPSLEEVSRG